VLQARRAVGVVRVCGVVLCGAVALAVPGLPVGSPVRVSVTASGGEAQFGGSNASISANGMFVAFDSKSDDLVPGDQDGKYDVFVRDVARGKTIRASAAPSGDEPNLHYYSARISANGRWVTFIAEPPVGGPTPPGFYAVYLRDLRTGALTRVTTGLGGAEPDGDSTLPSVSADGRYVAFRSDATNLVEGDTNGNSDVFVYDHRTRSIVRASTDSTGREAVLGASATPFISASGRYVAFASASGDLVEGDVNGSLDCFVKDLRTGRTTRVSLPDGGSGEANGTCTDPQVSSNGRWVVFRSVASNLVSVHTSIQHQVYLRDVKAQTTRRLSGPADDTDGNGRTLGLCITPNGRFVAFSSLSDNLTAGDTNQDYDVFVRDLRRGTLVRASVGPGGRELNGTSNFPSLSANGRTLAFHSAATNLADDDLNGSFDVFVVRLR
jgi:Tol biopolymer transport system component